MRSGATARAFTDFTTGASSNVFHASQDGQRPSQRADSNPHPVQKYADLALATSTLLRAGVP
jgi:hypothetical protein